MRVPNEFPTISSSYRLAVIGEAPGGEEHATGRPFVGQSGKLLWECLALAGLQRQQVFVGNLSQEQPPGNKLGAQDPVLLQQYLLELSKNLHEFQPNLCVLLGNLPLAVAKGQPLLSTRFPISSWRGTVFKGEAGPFASRKCMATYHPAFVLRSYEQRPLFEFDLVRAVRQSGDPNLVVATRNWRTLDTLQELHLWANWMRQKHPVVALDIEGGIDSMSCISFATSPHEAVVIPFYHKVTGEPCWSKADMEIVVEVLKGVLEDGQIPKVLQNALYDMFVLRYSYGIQVNGLADDTMLKAWEAYCELPKSLATQVSIYTDHPFYKEDRKSDDQKTFLGYCCTDSMLTYEINRTLTSQLTSAAEHEHYRFNLSLLQPLLYMELRGLRFDSVLAEERRLGLEKRITELEDQLTALVGRPINPKGGEWKPYLYEELGLPGQHKKNKVTGQTALTTDREALLKLRKLCHDALAPTRPYWFRKKEHEKVPWEKAAGILDVVLELEKTKTRYRQLAIPTDKDGRVRCAYNVVGTDTGRLTCYQSPTGSGANLQTIAGHDRDLFVPDPNHFIWQVDLTGADGWTVAANCAALGDRTMLDDLLAGIRIPSLLAAPLEWYSLPREELKTRLTKDKHDKVYKVVQHGSNYLMSASTMADGVFKQTDGQLVVSPSECQRIQNRYFARYPGVRMWHSAVARRIKEMRTLTTASGHTRMFFGRPWDAETVKQALAHEPQHNTTYANNLALRNMWVLPENRDEAGRFIAEPLHHVHDAIVGQFHQRNIGAAKDVIQRAFDNTLVIAGIPVKIPYEAKYGTSWGNLTHKLT